MENINRNSEPKDYTKDKHHVLWTRKDYRKSTLPHLMREHPAMKHQIDIADHRELHANMQPHYRMSVDLANSSLGFLANQLYQTNTQKFENYIGWLDSKSRSVGNLALEAGGFAENLAEQLIYIKGDVEPVNLTEADQAIQDNYLAEQLEFEYPQYNDGFKEIPQSDVYDNFRSIDDEVNIVRGES